MPIMNGGGTRHRNHQALSRNKDPAFSGQAGVSDIVREGEEKGYVFDVFAKPIHPEKLMEHPKPKKRLQPRRRI